MKKQLLSLLVLLAILTMAAGCQKEENLYEESNFDNVSAHVPEEQSQTSETESQEPLTGEIVFADKIYRFGDKNIAIVTVENKTNKDYSVTVCGNYMDADGNVIETEEKTFDQYSAGYKGYFLFQPSFAFERFSCTIKTEKADGPFYAKDVTLKFHGLEENMNYHMDRDAFEAGDRNKYLTLEARFSAEYSGQTDELKVCLLWVMIGDTEEVSDIFVKVNNPKVGFGESHQNVKIVQAYEGELIYPEQWKGEIRAIPVVELITTDENAVSAWAVKYPE